MAAEDTTLAERNRLYFDTLPQPATDPYIQAITSQITTFLTAPTTPAWLSLPPSPSLLDYACGTGTATRILHPLFSSCRGIDVSGESVKAYNAMAREIGGDKIVGVVGDLLAGGLEGWGGFGMVVVCMALHHVGDVEGLMGRLGGMVRDGGVVLVVDWVGGIEREYVVGKGVFWRGGPAGHGHGGDQHHGGHDHGEHQHHRHAHGLGEHSGHAAGGTIAHDGFTEAQMTGLLQKAGCTQVSWQLAAEPSRLPNGEKRLFFARGIKAG